MKTVLKLPTAKLLKIDSVHVDLDLNGDQHDRLVMGSEQNFERVMVSVMQELIEEDAYELPLSVNVSLFLAAKIQSLGYNWRVDWRCPAMIQKAETKDLVQCGSTNSYDLNAKELTWKELPSDYKYPRREFEGGDGSIYKVYCEYIPTAKEFEVLDYFFEQGIKKEVLFGDQAHLFSYFKRRWLYSVVIEDDRYRSLDTPEDKKKVLNDLRIPASVVNQLYQDLKKLDNVGYDLTPKQVKCKECSGAHKLQIPLQAGLLLSEG